MTRPLTVAEQQQLSALEAERDQIYDEMSRLAREMTHVSARIHEIQSGVYENDDS